MGVEKKNMNGTSNFISKVKRGLSINSNPGPGEYEVIVKESPTKNKLYDCFGSLSFREE